MRRSLAFLFTFLILFGGCSRLSPTTNEGDLQKKPQDHPAVATEDPDSPDSPGVIQEGLVLDDSQKADYTVTSKDNTLITLPCGSDAKLEVSFPMGAVDNDRQLTVTPVKSAPGKDDDYLSKGFFIAEKASTESVVINRPASIYYITSNDIPEDVSIIKYDETGNGYKVVPTQCFEMNGCHGLITFVDSFSAYGVKKVTQQEREAMYDRITDSGFNWHLEIDDHFRVIAEDGTDLTLIFKMFADNRESPGYLAMSGPYKGQAALGLYFMKDVGAELEGMEIPAVAGLVEKDDKASITLYPILDPELGENALPSLKFNDYTGKGKLLLTLDMVGFMGLDGDDGEVIEDISEVPFSIITRGPIAYATLNYEGYGYMSFKGSIVGQARVEGEEPNPPELEIAPLVAQDEISHYEPEDYSADLNDDGRPDASLEPDGKADIHYDNNGDGKTDITVWENEDGSFSYDENGDGKADLTLFPLTKK